MLSTERCLNLNLYFLSRSRRRALSEADLETDQEIKSATKKICLSTSEPIVSY